MERVVVVELVRMIDGGWLQLAIDQGLISTVLVAWIAFSDRPPRF